MILRRTNGASVCVLPVSGRSASEEKLQHSHSVLREDTAPLSAAALSASIPVSVFISLSLSLQVSLLLLPSLSLSLSLIVSPHISLSLSPAASRFLLPLLLFSPPTSPCMERRLTASPPLSLSPSIFLSPASRWLRKLGNLFADKVINTTLASFNIHHSALCFLTRSVRRERRRCAE